jgi:hypothetical protein
MKRIGPEEEFPSTKRLINTAEFMSVTEVHEAAVEMGSGAMIYIPSFVKIS